MTAEVVEWSPGPIEQTAEGYLLCYECDGAQRCPCCKGHITHAPGEPCLGPVFADASTTRCRQCSMGPGWCYLCGGAGQIPLDAGAGWDKPGFAMVDRAQIARTHGRG